MRRLKRKELVSAAGRLEAPNYDVIALVLQGGGALGAYQAGVYEGLHEAGIRPNWVAGISIGALNAAIIAGSPEAQRVDRLRAFWETICASPVEWPVNEGLAEAMPFTMDLRSAHNIAAATRALGLTVIGTDLRPAPEVVDRYYVLAQLPAMLSQADVLVLMVPHTPQTEKMIGAKELATLPRAAYLINIARGAVIDEPALFEALQSGHLGGAALDVFAEEPLPPPSRL